MSRTCPAFTSSVDTHAMIIDRLQLSDLDRIGDMTPEGWGDIRPQFAHNIQSSRCLPLKVELEGVPAGLGNINYNGSTAWLSQIIVRPAFRNKGLGKIITAALLDHIDRQRYGSVLLDATDLGYSVYRHFGFATISRHLHFRNELLPAVPALPPLRPFRQGDREAILQLDRIASGEDRSGFLLENLQEVLVYDQEGEVTGVYLPGWGRGAVLASVPEAGTALLRYRLQTSEHSMLPEENQPAICYLKQSGGQQLRTSRRMCLGPLPDWNPAYTYNATGGALG